MKTIIIHFDGGCKPGGKGYGSFEIKGDTATLRESKFEFPDKQTSNTSERSGA